MFLKKTMRLLLVILCSVTAWTADGQSSDSLAVKHYYEQNTIYWAGGKWYFKGDVKYPFKNLKNELKLSKEATLEFKAYRRANRNVIISTLLFDGFVLGMITTEEITPFLLLTSAAVLTGGLTFAYSRQAFAHLQRAIWAYNRDVLLR